MQIRSADFQPGEMQQALSQLELFDSDDDALQAQLAEYFNTFDSDHNDYLDQKELRHFLESFFGTYHIRAPLTDEYVDATFREIDANKDNKIQPEELHAYASRFVKVLIIEFRKATIRQQQAEQQAEQAQQESLPANTEEAKQPCGDEEEKKE